MESMDTSQDWVQKYAAKSTMEILEDVLKMPNVVPPSCRVQFRDSSILLKVKPTVFTWSGAAFWFSIKIPRRTSEPPIVRAMTRIWHPCVTSKGKVLLNLREPVTVARVPQIIWCISRLFTHQNLEWGPVGNFNAYEMYVTDPLKFYHKTREYMKKYRCLKNK